MFITRIRKWIERISRYIEKILSPKVNGGNNYKEDREDFDICREYQKGNRCKGRLLTRVDKATDLISTEYIDFGDWEEFISDNEVEAEIQSFSAAFIQLFDKPARRIRRQNQTEEEKIAWDEETRQIRNAKARETRVRKKVEKKA